MIYKKLGKSLVSMRFLSWVRVACLLMQFWGETNSFKNKETKNFSLRIEMDIGVAD